MYVCLYVCLYVYLSVSMGVGIFYSCRLFTRTVRVTLIDDLIGRLIKLYF